MCLFIKHLIPSLCMTHNTRTSGKLSKAFCFVLFWFRDWISCRPCLPWICYVVENNFELWILMVMLPKNASLRACAKSLVSKASLQFCIGNAFSALQKLSCQPSYICYWRIYAFVKEIFKQLRYMHHPSACPLGISKSNFFRNWQNLKKGRKVCGVKGI